MARAYTIAFPTLVYVGSFPILHDLLGPAAAGFGVLLVAFAGWIGGIRIGLTIGLVESAARILHFQFDQELRWASVEVVNTLVGSPFVLGIGAGAGAISRLASRADALAKRIQSQRELLQAVLGAAPVVIFGFDPQGVVFLSEGREPLLGPSDTAPKLGESLFDRPGAPPALVDACRRALQGEEVTTTLSVGDRVIEQRLRPWVVEGETVAVLGTAHEITGELATASLRALHAEEVALLTDASPDLITRWSRDLHRTYANPAASRLRTCPPRASLVDCFPPELASIWVQRLRAVLAGSPEERFEFAMDVSGTTREFDVRAVPQRDQHGNVVSVLAITHDVSVERAAARALEASERRHRLLLQRSSDTTSVVGPDGRFRYVSEGVVGTLGFAPAELIGKDAMELVHPEDQAVARENLAIVFARTDGEPIRQRIRYLHKNGSWRVLEVTAAGYTEDPAIGGVILNNHDVTGQVAAEERERATQLATDLITKHLREALYIIELDPYPHPVWVSDAWTHLTGQAVADVLAIPEKWLESVVPEDRALAMPAGWEDGYDTEFRVAAADGTVRWVHNRGVLLPSQPGSPRRMVGVTEDITERRAAQMSRQESEEHLARIQQLEELSRFKTTLLNTAAHELATPLTPILLEVGSLEATLVPKMGEDERRSFDLLSGNLDRLARLISDLLDAARIQRGSLALRIADVDGAQLLHEAIGTFSAEADLAGVELSIETPRPLPLRADPQRLSQVFVNLLSNALKFTPRGGRVLLRANQGEGEAVVTITDTGIGMAPAQMERLFQPFTQVHDASVIQKGGTGLGLYVSRGIVEQHGGRISVRSDGPGLGTTFEVRLPLAGASPSATPPVVVPHAV